MSALLQEIISIYPVLSPPALTAVASNRVCNALALLQCVASHNDTRALFLHGEIKPLSPSPFMVLGTILSRFHACCQGKWRQPVLLLQVRHDVALSDLFKVRRIVETLPHGLPLSLAVWSHRSSRSRFLSRSIIYFHSVICVM
jgi:hypothetical protein